MHMFLNYFRYTLRFILKYKGYSIINILGFSLALVPTIYAVLFISYEFSYDKFYDNYEYIYRLVVDKKLGDNTVSSPIMPNALASVMKREFPEIRFCVQLRNFPEMITINNNKFLEKDVCYADPDILKLFSIKLLKGDILTSLNSPNSILLNKSVALKYFGNKDPINKVLQLGNYQQMIIKGVFEDLPENSHFHANFIVPKSLITGQQAAGFNDENSWGYSMYFTYFMVLPNTDVNSLLLKMPKLLRENSSNDFFNRSKLYFQPLKDIHLYSNLQTELSKNGNIKTVYLFILISLIILIIAIVNYINLTTARLVKRSKEIAMRRIIGADTKQLFIQIMTESAIITFLSFIISIVITIIAVPKINNLIDRDIPLSILFNHNVIIAAIILLVVISFCSGIYPALSVLSVKPLNIFKKGNFSSNKNLRDTLVIFQFVLSIVLVFNSSMIKKQLSYITSKNLGYNRNNIIILNIYSKLNNGDLQTFKNSLLQNPLIEKIAFSVNLPNSSVCKTDISWEGKNLSTSMDINYNLVDYDFIDLYGIKLVEGRNFSKDYQTDQTVGIILNENAAKKIGNKELIGKTIKQDDTKRQVIGVVNDFHMYSLYENISPFYLAIDSSATMYYCSIKIYPDSFQKILPFIKNKFHLLQQDLPFKYEFFDDIIDVSYKSEKILDSILNWFSFFSIFIASMGIYGLISFVTEARQKEIGIRKVVGANSWQIAYELFYNMIKLIVISSLIAAPIAYLLINKWLSNFAYRTDIDFKLFIITSFVIYLWSSLAMATQIYKASTKNPTEVMRYE